MESDRDAATTERDRRLVDRLLLYSLAFLLLTPFAVSAYVTGFLVYLAATGLTRSSPFRFARLLPFGLGLVPYVLTDVVAEANRVFDAIDETYGVGSGPAVGSSPR